ncbi:predicted protein [Sclerotinia sclerotiorum 1980 UF-70]|uniref:Uncharacterized protein n=1 Tax=Sclerotinia sclerotiorum (strain ATCC 18683 / 1980 / Ss-1) TaxID=665079 RepID=A7F5S0_SCLS1|nr:predicted protein [Sclerotinia sclerotiorum 1980 UF-70]EDN98091.1 predicted protein [Sclerotinia sclerotiorum 1980 UF-70]
MGKTSRGDFVVAQQHQKREELGHFPNQKEKIREKSEWKQVEHLHE